ncbi:MAG: DNA mismatch repair protein MutS [Gemmataceae bacterium]
MNTPMMQQYREAKERHPGMLLLFRAGDFYELFFDDAELVARVLGLTLTSRDRQVPMAGFPHHALELHLRKLLRAGHRVAVCDQVEDASQAKGRLIRREVTRVVTPGTLTDDNLLDPRQANHLVALAPGGRPRDPVGVAWVELSTGVFQAADVPRDRLADELDRLAPSECLIGEMAGTAEAAPLLERLRESLGNLTVTPRPDWTFDPASARAALHHHFAVSTMAGFGFDDDQPCLSAAGALMLYLQETLKSSLGHLRRLRPHAEGRHLALDEVTRRALELTRTLRDGGRQGSVLSVIDRTVTAMGARQLADWLLAPLADRDAIAARHEAVAELLDEHALRGALRDVLTGVLDLQRLTARVSTGRASPRDLAAVGKTLALLPRVKALLADRRAGLLADLESRVEVCPDLRETLDAALVDVPPLVAREGGIFKRGYHAELDELVDITVNGKDWMLRYQQDEARRTGIASLKVGYNQVFGYYIEITNANASRIPSDYQRKQTLKNAERYITSELKEYEEKVLTAQERINQLEYDLFIALRDEVARRTAQLLGTAEVLATLDVLAGLAELAAERSYVRPELTDEPVIEVHDGRHPVLDQTLPPGTFVPNDATLGPTQGMFYPYRTEHGRQVGLSAPGGTLTLLAQMGSFVPRGSADRPGRSHLHASVPATTWDGRRARSWWR